ncbi:MAG TPA: tripartite tricarboxylate transporter substrate binding protein [Alphaproteobacteria bacterium]
MIVPEAVRIAALGMALALAVPSALAAETWPSRPVRIVIPYSPGGSTDTLGRLAAQKLGDAFGQQFVPDNRTGGGGIIGSEMVARAAPDGYTFVISSLPTIVIGPILNAANWNFDPLKDYTHVALLGETPSVLVTDTRLPATTLAEFIAVAKSTAGGLSYGTAGIGSSGHIFGEMLQLRTGIRMTHVPYRGANQAVADLMGHQLPVGFLTLQTAAEQIGAGAVRALAVTTRRRLPTQPDLPTFLELGYPDLAASTWFALAAPAGLPPEIVQKVNAAIVKGFQEPDVRSRLERDGIEFEPFGPAEFNAFVHAEYDRWAPVVRTLAAKAN